MTRRVDEIRRTMVGEALARQRLLRSKNDALWGRLLATQSDRMTEMTTRLVLGKRAGVPKWPS